MAFSRKVSILTKSMTVLHLAKKGAISLLGATLTVRRRVTFAPSLVARADSILARAKSVIFLVGAGENSPLCATIAVQGMRLAAIAELSIALLPDPHEAIKRAAH